MKLARGSATETLAASFRRLKPVQQLHLAEAVAELNSATAEVQSAINGDLVAAPNRPQNSFSDVQSIESEELIQLIVELMSEFEGSAEYDSSMGASWVSADGQTEVCHHGSSGALRGTLVQDPDAVLNEYYILHCGVQVFCWRDLMWPELSLTQELDAWCTLPVNCLYDLIAFHRQHKTRWNSRWVKQGMSAVDETRSTVSKVDKVNIMPKLNIIKSTKQQLHIANG
ncbi:MAG: hypothetical protein V3U76_01610 [Granulosicoccus sp.]